MNHSLELEKYAYTLSPNRQVLAGKFMDKKWFNNSSLIIQKQILSLPNDFEGFVFDLSNRPDKLGDLEINKLVKLVHGSYILTPVFQVYSTRTGKTFTYEYVSWKTGPNSGVKGTLFIEKDGKIKYFVTLEMEKFAPAKKHLDTIGGLVQYAGDKLLNLPDKVEKSLKEQLGLSSLVIKQFFDLGKLSPDNGLTNNHPLIFAAIIDGEHSKKLNQLSRKQVKTSPQEFNLQITPIDQLASFISISDDAFFLSIICRLLAKKVISL